MHPSPAVSLDAMRRARSTLEDFVSSYFMFHHLDASEPLHVFKHLPLLMFVEAHIYQLDQENENFLAAPKLDNQHISSRSSLGTEQNGQCLERNFSSECLDYQDQPKGSEQESQAFQRLDLIKRVPAMEPLRNGDIGKQNPAEGSSRSSPQVGLKRDAPANDVDQDPSCLTRKLRKLLAQEADSLRGRKVHCCLGSACVSNEVSGAITSRESESVLASKATSLAKREALENLADTAFAPLSSLLHKETLLTGRIAKELLDGLEFWRLERKLCQELESREQLSRIEVERAVAQKSFDYRVLNLILYGLEKKEVNEQHMEFLEASELLVEISDDLFDYEDDVLNNTFNVYRMFLAMYGPEQGQLELARWISDIERRYEGLLNGLEKGLADKYRERCRSAAKEGGSKTDASSPMGSWSLPPPIIDEVAYRSEVQ